jgi:hypothetical protein
MGLVGGRSDALSRSLGVAGAERNGAERNGAAGSGQNVSERSTSAAATLESVIWCERA